MIANDVATRLLVFCGTLLLFAHAQMSNKLGGFADQTKEKNLGAKF